MQDDIMDTMAEVSFKGEGFIIYGERISTKVRWGC